MAMFLPGLEVEGILGKVREERVEGGAAHGEGKDCG